MPVFDPVTAASLLILAAGPQLDCTPPRPAKITVSPKSAEVTYDTSKSLQEIQNFQVDTVNPYGFHEMSFTQGFMQGQMRIAPSIRIASKTWPGMNAACLWYEDIRVDMQVTPQIVIAREVSRDSCMNRAVREHEMKHVKADRAVLNKYAKTIGDRLYQELGARGFSSGVIPVSAAQDIAQRMQQTVYQLVEHEYKKMELERAELQGAIDSRAEYDRVSALCPGFEVNMDMVKGKKRKSR